MSNEKQYPAPDEIKGELEQYLASPEAEANEQKLNDAQVAKAKLEELGVEIPAQLQSQIEELEAKNPLNKVPKWATRNEWIKVMESRKDKLQKAIDDLGDIKPAMRRELEAEIARIDEKLVEPKEEFGGKSRADYAKSIKKVVGLKDDKEKGDRTLTPEQAEELLGTLKERFENNKERHKGIEWSQVESRLNEASPEKLWSLNEMERTGGEPDVVGIVEETGEVEFWDCSKESPEGRRNLSYDREGQEVAEKEGKSPAGNAIDIADDMRLGGILNEEQIKKLSKLVKDLFRASLSWVDTSEETRKTRGGALRACRINGVIDVDVVHPSGSGGDWGFHGWLRV